MVSRNEPFREQWEILIENIAKGTTDPRVEFISQVQTQILIKFHLQNLDQASTSTSTEHQHLYKTSAEKNCPNSSFKSCLNFKILTKPCAQSISNSLTFFTKPQLRNLQQIAANKILISNSCNINKF